MRPNQVASRTRRASATSERETWVARGTASRSSVAKNSTEPGTPILDFAPSDSARPITPPTSISSEKTTRRPKAIESRAGTDRNNRPKPAAFEPGLSTGFCQNRRQPQ
jgi:hypothetical protein